ncbi:MAG TPA: ABC transporter permease [Gemmatimonadaceae bacterium]|nr:ABC transporter permease [Gemmatimonadaceae bacterium]
MQALRSFIRFFADFGENVSLAFGSLRVAKMRSALTILGVVIGVATVMAMASIVQGIRDQIVQTIEIAGPTTFYVMKVWSQSPLNPDALPKWVRVRPDLSRAEAERIQRLPEIDYASIWGQVMNRVEYQGERTQPGVIMGADDRYSEIYGGDLAAGRWFTRSEMASGRAVAVIDVDVARRLFGSIQPLDKLVRIGGRPVRVIGVYQPSANIFQPPGQKTHAIVPFAMLDHQFTIDRTNALFIPVKPRPGVTVTDAQEAVTVALREMRGLRPADRNTFDMITQDQILDTFNKMTGVFFLVMIVLSGVGLLVGGIGVMAVMMISVTERTREIGIRKAVGATRRDILQQFLIEAATLTGTGGAIGIAIGLGLGQVATLAMNISASPPLDLTALAVLVSVSIGLVFGLIPARRAAKLDPIESLRYE